MYFVIKAPGHGNIVVDGINATEKRYFKEQMELLCKLSGNNTSKIIMLNSASKYVSIKSIDQFLNNLNNNDRLNGLKGRKKCKR